MPIFANDCQCRQCQHISGTGHGSYLTFPSKENVHISGKTGAFTQIGDSGNAKTNCFCFTCGSPVYMTFAAMPDLFTIHAASLDDPRVYTPQVVTYASKGWDWDKLDPSLPKFDQMPIE